MHASRLTSLEIN